MFNSGDIVVSNQWQPEFDGGRNHRVQAQFWSCLRRAGITDQQKGFGQIFSCPGTSLLPQV